MVKTITERTEEFVSSLSRILLVGGVVSIILALFVLLDPGGMFIYTAIAFLWFGISAILMALSLSRFKTDIPGILGMEEDDIDEMGNADVSYRY